MALHDDYAAMTDADLQAQTKQFQQQLSAGTALADILVPAYATVAEADQRVLGMRPYDTQILGAVVMADRNVAEMKTGEGKTLMATLPMYLHGLTGPGNFLITANAYLANRDAAQMGRVYRWLGLTVQAGASASGQTGDDDGRDKQAIYSADIVYTTNGALGFDYLIDNLASTPADQYIPPFQFALLDEVDAVLLDMASMPLIISGAPRVQSNLYTLADDAIRLLTEDVDYELSDDTKQVWFTDHGIDFLAQYFAVPTLLDKPRRALYRHLVMALKVNFTLVRDRDYVVADNQVYLLDLSNGRKLTGMKLEAGLHQAIEAKEHVPLTPQTRAMASITFQNLFRMFPQLAGMTGTAMTDAAELQETYGLQVVPIPTHKPSIRVDRPDQLFPTVRAKVAATLPIVRAAHARQQPVLIETGSVSMSVLYSRVLLNEGLPHNLLNARSAAKEAQIVAEAGRLGAITVATSMAGRGTDIHLDPAVPGLGGLLVIGTERMSSARVDNQLRGRAGRQGYPGATQFFTSLEDRIMIEHAPKWVDKFRLHYTAQEAAQASGDTLPQPLVKSKFRRVVAKAQKVTQNGQRSSRFQTLQFDEVFRLQRQYIYSLRDRVMVMAAEPLNALFQKVLGRAITDFLADHSAESVGVLGDFIINHIDRHFRLNELIVNRTLMTRQKELRPYLAALAQKQWEKQADQLPEDQFLAFQRLVFLRALDNAWIEQVDTLQQLKTVVGDRARGQRDPTFEYQKEARRAFRTMSGDFALRAMTQLLLSELHVDPASGSVDVTFP
ncbi:accessory Sec system translocase SecA2 [Schleiferilactobacillus shenzhenensis]|nr:accessory Sec system translocase SecA2 [Schleiferilactobacillus shenzhenensis]